MIEDTSSEESSYISSVSSSETSSERSSDIVGAPRESQSDSPDPVILKILRKIEALETRRANTHRRIDTAERLLCEIESLNRIFQLQSYRLLPNNNNNDRMADERPPSVPKRHFTKNPYADYVNPKSAPLREDSYTRTLREYADPSIQPLDDAIPFVHSESRVFNADQDSVRLPWSEKERRRLEGEVTLLKEEILHLNQHQHEMQARHSKEIEEIFRTQSNWRKTQSEDLGRVVKELNRLKGGLGHVTGKGSPENQPNPSN